MFSRSLIDPSSDDQKRMNDILRDRVEAGATDLKNPHFRLLFVQHLVEKKRAGRATGAS
jgi:hypothetical protein